MKKTTYKSMQLFLVLITIIVFFASLYFQYFLGLQPCPLCIMQRFCVFLLLCLMGLSLGTLKKAHLISLLQVIISCAGLFFCVRQLWLQSLPADQAPACMPGLDVLLHYFPWQDAVKALLWGSGDCAEKTWGMLGVSMPGWAAMYFLFMAISGLFLFYSTRAGAITIK